MKKLRCWPGCHALITGKDAPGYGRTLVCDKIYPGVEPPCWTYKSAEIWVTHPVTLERVRIIAVEDACLTPLEAPPGPPPGSALTDLPIEHLETI